MKKKLAGCVIADDYGRVLMLHRATGERTQWELPGGKIERGETAEQAAVRELAEELGVRVRLIASLGKGQWKDEADEYDYAWFQADIEDGELQILEPDTFDDFDYFDLEDMMSLALSDNMQIVANKIASGEIVLQS